LRRSWRLQRHIEAMEKLMTVHDQISPTLLWSAKEAWVVTWQCWAVPDWNAFHEHLCLAMMTLPWQPSHICLEVLCWGPITFQSWYHYVYGHCILPFGAVLSYACHSLHTLDYRDL
jgi:hypothetical protein